MPSKVSQQSATREGRTALMILLPMGGMEQRETEDHENTSILEDSSKSLTHIDNN